MAEKTVSRSVLRDHAWREVVASASVLAALAAWLVSLATFDRDALTSMGDLGLAPLLPASFHVALLLTAIAFTLTVVRSRPVAWLAGAAVALLVSMLQATPAVLYGTPRYPFAYKHLGVTEFVQRVGGLDLTIDAYFNWAGFFALSAFATALAGLGDAFALAVWAPVAMSAAFVATVGMLAAALTKDVRLAWVTAWFFALANWIGQDYYAPQAIGFILHVAVLALYVSWFVQRRWRLTSTAVRAPRTDGANLELEAAQATPTSAWQRMAVLTVIVVLFGAMVSAHQLSPFVTIVSITGLILLGVGGARFLPVVMLTLVAVWFVTMTVPFLAGNLGWLLSAVGRLFDNLSLASRPLTAPAEAVISDERAFVLAVRQWVTIGIAMLTVLGGIRRIRRGYVDVAAIALLVAPATLIAMQPYGGEMILRIYLFSLPVAAWFMGALVFVNRASGHGLTAMLTLLALSTALLPTTVIAGYGNESMNYISPAEIAALESIYERAPDAALVVTMTNNAPIRHARYGDVVYLELSEDRAAADVVRASPDVDADRSDGFADHLTSLAERAGHAAVFVLFTRNQIANARLFGLLDGIDLADLERDVMASERFETLFEHQHAAVARLRLDTPNDVEALP